VKTPNIQSEVQTIGPATAKAYLAKAAPNRSINKRHVDRLAKAMSSGAWKTTHQGIAFDENGQLCDGQHRLAAIVQSGKTVKIVVSRYATEAPMAVLDSGSSRNVSDRVQIAGVIPDHVAMSVAVLNAMLIAETGASRKETLQPHEIEKLYDREQAALRFAITAFGTKQSRQWNSIVRAAFAYCAEFAPAETGQLATMIREKVGYKKGSAAQAFVMALSEDKLSAGSNADRIDTMAKCLWLIRAHIEGKPVERVKATAAIFNWAARQRQAKNRLMVPLIK
jgi:hypothetical protein